MNFLKTSLFFVCLLPLKNLLAQESQNAEISCMQIIEKLETGELTDETLYDKCGFHNKELAWNKWAGIVSEKKFKRAIFELCVRYPKHEYHERYCQKAIDLNHAPALIYKGKQFIEKNEFQQGYEYFRRALDTNTLTEKDEADILETLGVYYFKNKDEKAWAYLENASKKNSALANTIIGYNYIVRHNDNMTNERTGVEYLWRAILKGCTTAEEIYGLYKLAKQEQISFEKAEFEMRKQIYSCTPVVEQSNINTPDHLFDCRCKSAIDTANRHKEKSYILRKVEAKMAVLEDPITGETLSVTENNNLPNGANVTEVRKTAIILTYPNEVREIINLYQNDECLDFCKKHNIQENLNSSDMRLKIEGGKEKIKIGNMLPAVFLPIAYIPILGYLSQFFTH